MTQFLPDLRQISHNAVLEIDQYRHSYFEIFNVSPPPRLADEKDHDCSLHPTPGLPAN